MADKYWVGGSGYWKEGYTGNWSYSSGGEGGAPEPTDMDTVIFDENSFTEPTGNYVYICTGIDSWCDWYSCGSPPLDYPTEGDHAKCDTFDASAVNKEVMFVLIHHGYGSHSFFFDYDAHCPLSIYGSFYLSSSCTFKDGFSFEGYDYGYMFGPSFYIEMVDDFGVNTIDIQGNVDTALYIGTPGSQAEFNLASDLNLFRPDNWYQVSSWENFKIKGGTFDTWGNAITASTIIVENDATVEFWMCDINLWGYFVYYNNPSGKWWIDESSTSMYISVAATATVISDATDIYFHGGGSLNAPNASFSNVIFDNICTPEDIGDHDWMIPDYWNSYTAHGGEAYVYTNVEIANLTIDFSAHPSDYIISYSPPVTDPLYKNYTFDIWVKNWEGIAGLYDVTVDNKLIIKGYSQNSRILVQGGQLNYPMGYYHDNDNYSTLSAEKFELEYVDFAFVNNPGVAFFGTMIGDVVGNTGIIGEPPQDRYWVGNSGDWSDWNHWAASSGGAGGETVPMPQDTVYFDENSVDADGFFTYISQSILGRNVYVDVDYQFYIAGDYNSSHYVCGDLQIANENVWWGDEYSYPDEYTLADDYNFSNLYLIGQGAYTILINNRFYQDLAINPAYGGSYSLIGDLNLVSNAGLWGNGDTFDANGYNIMASGVGMTLTNLYMGSGMWLLNGDYGNQPWDTNIDNLQGEDSTVFVNGTYDNYFYGFEIGDHVAYFNNVTVNIPTGLDPDPGYIDFIGGTFYMCTLTAMPGTWIVIEEDTNLYITCDQLDGKGLQFLGTINLFTRFSSWGDEGYFFNLHLDFDMTLDYIQIGDINLLPGSHKIRIGPHSVNLLNNNFELMFYRPNLIYARARINPPANFLSAVLNPARKITKKLEIQWDGMTWTDESARLVSVKGDTELSGDQGETMASEADFELQNTDKRFTQGADSELEPYLKPRVQIRFSLNFGNTTWLRIFTGYIKSYTPNVLSGICNLHCFDNTQFILNKPAARKVYVGQPIDQIIADLAEEAGLTSAQYTLDPAEIVLPTAWVKDQYINPVMSDLAIAEQGRVFFDEYGILRFWNRSHLFNVPSNSIVSLTKADWLKDINYEIDETAIKNRCVVKTKPRAPAGLQTVWTNGDILALNQYSDTLVWIPAGQTQSAYLEMDDPCVDYVEPVAVTDYTANSMADQQGDDLTANIEITEFITYDDAVFLTVRNNGAVDAFLTTFQVRANPLRVYRWIKSDYKDDESILLYGEQLVEIENDYITTEEIADSMALNEVERSKKGVNNFRAEIIGIPYLHCGDVVNVEMPNASLDRFMINKLEWTFDENGFNQTLEFIEPFLSLLENTISAKARIVVPTIKTIVARARILNTTKTISAKARIGIWTLRKTVTAVGSIKGLKTRTITAKANIWNSSASASVSPSSSLSPSASASMSPSSSLSPSASMSPSKSISASKSPSASISPSASQSPSSSISPSSSVSPSMSVSASVSPSASISPSASVSPSSSASPSP